MEVLSSRVLLQPTDFEKSFRFYSETLGLHVYREWGSEANWGVVFFLQRIATTLTHVALLLRTPRPTATIIFGGESCE